MGNKSSVMREKCCGMVLHGGRPDPVEVVDALTELEAERDAAKDDARLHAEKLADALRDAVSALREIRDDNKARGALYSSKTQGLCRAALKVAGGALENLENEERK